MSVGSVLQHEESSALRDLSDRRGKEGIPREALEGSCGSLEVLLTHLHPRQHLLGDQRPESHPWTDRELCGLRHDGPSGARRYCRGTEG